MACKLSNASENILNVYGSISNNLSLAHSWASLCEVVEAVVVSLSDSEKSFGTIDLVTEIRVVNLVNVSLIHVTSEDSLSDVLGCSDFEQIENTEELNLCNVTVFSAVEILEHWLKVDAADLDGSSVLIKDSAEFLFSVSTLEILAAGKQSVILSDSGNTYCRGLVDSRGGKCLVNASGEINVVEELLGVVGLISGSKGFVLCIGEVKVELAQDREELALGHVTLTQLIEILEELFDTNALHNNKRTKTVLDIARVTGNVNTRLLVTIVNHIDVISWFSKEGRHSGWRNSSSVFWGRKRVFCDVTGEDVFRTVKVLAELEVIDFSRGATIAVLSNNHVKDFLRSRHETKTLEDSKELMGSDVKLLGSIKIHEAGLEEDPLRLDLVVHVCDSFHHLVFFGVREHGVRLSSFNLIARARINVSDESGVVNHAGSVVDSVTVDEVVDLGLVQVDVESAETGAEL